MGAWRFATGLAKKVLLANLLGELCAVYAAAEVKTVLFAWVNALAWMLQVYYDFSGYSDMAIGLGHILGFTFPENFNYPFCARTVTEFWRRWHMTLSGWFRDYVYIPMGGSRVSTVKWCRNVLVVWLLTGLWHGAAWNFVAWGICYGLLLILEKQVLRPYLEKLGKLSHVYLIAVSLVLFTLFGDNSLSNLTMMFGGGIWSDGNTLYYFRSYALVLLAAIIGTTPLIRQLYEKIRQTQLSVFLDPGLVIGSMLLCTAYLIDGSFNPFLYFRF